jgi:two-component system LytT family response regulator
MKKNVAIVDDEVASRQLIKEYLQYYPQFSIVGEATNGLEAVALIQTQKPDLVFLDVQMPALTGFEVLARLEEIPQIIFATAYDQYALKAFEVHALDYLLKPFTKKRFESAIERAMPVENLQPFAENLVNKSTYFDKLFVPYLNRLVSIATQDILWIEADGDYAQIITKRNKFMSSEGLGGLENKLNPEYFMRIHRSTIINLQYVKEVQSKDSNFFVLMQNDELLRVSRANKDKIKERII